MSNNNENEVESQLDRLKDIASRGRLQTQTAKPENEAETEDTLELSEALIIEDREDEEILNQIEDSVDQEKPTENLESIVPPEEAIQPDTIEKQRVIELPQVDNNPGEVQDHLKSLIEGDLLPSTTVSLNGITDFEALNDAIIKGRVKIGNSDGQQSAILTEKALTDLLLKEKERAQNTISQIQEHEENIRRIEREMELEKLKNEKEREVLQEIQRRITVIKTAQEG